MKSLAILIVCTAMSVGNVGCTLSNASSNGGRTAQVVGSNNYVTKSIPVSDFSKISVSGSHDVFFTQRDGKPEVVVYGQDNIVDLLDIQVNKGVLLVRFKRGVSVSYKKLEVRVSAPRLTGINVGGSSSIVLSNGLRSDDNLSFSVAGSGDVAVRGNLSCRALEATVSGSGDCEMETVQCSALESRVSGSGDIHIRKLTTGTVRATISGSGDMSLGGTAETATYTVSGSADLSTEGLKANRVSVSVSGSGEVSCHAVEYLKASISGGGSIEYKGDPELNADRRTLRNMRKL